MIGFRVSKAKRMYGIYLSIPRVGSLTLTFWRKRYSR